MGRHGAGHRGGRSGGHRGGRSGGHRAIRHHGARRHIGGRARGYNRVGWGWGWNRPRTVVVGGYGGYGYSRRPVACISFWAIFLVVLAIILVSSLAPRSSSSKSSKDPNVELTSFESYVLQRNNRWFQSVTVTVPYNSPTVVYAFDELPPLSQTVQKNEHQKLSVSPDQYEFYAYYLTEGSSIQVDYSTESLVHFYVIAGDKDWERWQDGVDTQIYSSYSRASATTPFLAVESEYYYVVWDNIGLSTISGSANVNITLKDYDYSLATRTYNFTPPSSLSTCVLDFDFASDQVGIVRSLQQNSPNDVTTIKFTWKARTSYYWAVIGGSVGAVLGLILIIAICACVCIRRKQSAAALPAPAVAPAPAPYQAPSTPYQAPSTPYQASGTPYQAPPSAPIDPAYSAPPSYNPDASGYGDASAPPADPKTPFL